MAALRTTSFYQGTPAAPGSGNLWTTVYTVPSGHVIIVKNIVMFNATASSKIGGTRTDGLIVIRQATLATSTNDNYLPWVVLNPGQALEVLQQAGGAISYLISGSLLYV